MYVCICMVSVEWGERCNGDPVHSRNAIIGPRLAPLTVVRYVAMWGRVCVSVEEGADTYVEGGLGGGRRLGQ